MTVQQLLSWVSFAHDRHDCSFDDITEKHTICLKQALLEAEPKIESHGYGTSEGERELAIVLIHTCNYNEVCDMENNAYNISQSPLGIPTNVSHRTELEPFYISANEAIRQAEASRAFANIHNPPELPPVGEILYERPASMWGAIEPPTQAPFMESPLRALSVEESRAVLSEALASINPQQDSIMSTTEMGAYMQEVLNGPVAEGCTIPMDLRTSA